MTDRRHAAVAALATLPLVVVGALNLTDAAIMDETVFLRAADAMARTGRPLFYHSETGGYQWGLWHPPTYVTILSGLTHLGDSPAIYRSGTFLFTVLTAPLVYILASVTQAGMTDGSGDERSKWRVSALAVGLYSVAPVVIQNGTLIDINGSILGLVSTAVLAAFVHAEFTDETSQRALAIITGGVFIVAWVKFGILPPLLAGIGLYYLCTGNPRAMARAAVASIVGFALFTVSWASVAEVLGYPALKPFIHNLGMFFAGPGGTTLSPQRRLLISAWALYDMVVWINPLFIGLAALALVKPVRAAISQRSWVTRSPVIILGIFVGTALLQYTAMGGVPYGFVKYVGPIMPAIAVLAAVAIDQYVVLESMSARDWTTVVVVSGLITIVTFALPDPFIVPFDQGEMRVLFHSLTVLGVLGVLTVVSVGLVLATRRIDRRGALVVALVVALLGINFGLIATQTTAEYNTRYFYGNTGFEETVEWTKSEYTTLSQSQQASVVAPVDVGYHLNGTYTTVAQYDLPEQRGSQPPIIVLRHQKYFAVTSSLLQEVQQSPAYNCTRAGSFLHCKHR